MVFCYSSLDRLRQKKGMCKARLGGERRRRIRRGGNCPRATSGKSTDMVCSAVSSTVSDDFRSISHAELTKHTALLVFHL